MVYGAKIEILSLPVSDRDHMRGLGLASVTLVEYGDYQCPYTRQAYPIVENILKRLNNLIKFVYRHFPIPDKHPYAEIAAEAAEIAGAQGQFWAMHEQLFTRPSLDEASLKRYAAEIGLDSNRFGRELEMHLPAGRVREDIQSGFQSGVNGTPTFFVNGLRHNGSWEFDSLFSAVKLYMKNS